jgi:uncharacterized protein YqjF (DUF2071 family)
MHSALKPEGRADEVCARRQSLSQTARARLLSLPGEPLFIADWLRTLMIHYEVEPAALQQAVPFQLDLHADRAFLSAVAFTLNAMRPRIASRVTGWLLKPISTHHFLNVRTYVRVNGQTGIYFLAEWLSNPLSVALGPLAFGLPYRFARIEYHHKWKLISSNASAPPCSLRGRIDDPKSANAFAYTASVPPEPQFRQCDSGSVTEWLMERYTAFTKYRSIRRFFRVWHQPWLQTPAEVSIIEQSLLDRNWPLFRDARIVGANFSAALTDVWMGWPHRIRA